ncbi:hypothetical protein [Nitrospira sp. BLG_1]|uniref:hypothetical protein n=1 Tax=Nitrospira sp. BLG_1 TaxID=3395883 RepID=UPI0039BCD39F
MNELTIDELKMLRALLAPTNLRISGTVAECMNMAQTYLTIASKLDAAISNNPSYQPSGSEPVNPVEGISVPPRFDEHGKLEPGCL